jgi:hypothetical protein
MGDEQAAAELSADGRSDSALTDASLITQADWALSPVLLRHDALRLFRLGLERAGLRGVG